MADPDVRDVTLGEVYRLVTKVDSRLDTITQQMVGRAEYEADQGSLERRLTVVEAATAAAATAASTAERERQREAGQRRFSIAAMLATPIVGAIIAWIVAGGLVR